MNTNQDWPVAFFDDDYLTIYKPMFSEEMTEREVGFIEKALELRGGAAVLDLACGFGRHANGMARRGYRMTGLDFNQNYLDIASAVSKEQDLPVEWKQGDMRELPFSELFDAAYSYFTSFGYFSDEENEKVIEGVARGLKSGGRFLLDVMNREWILTHQAHRIWNQRENGSLLVEEVSLELESSRVKSKQIHIAPDGGPRLEKEFDLRAYTCAELQAMLRRHGLSTRHVWGGPDESPYTTKSRRLILLAAKDG